MIKIGEQQAFKYKINNEKDIETKNKQIKINNFWYLYREKNIHTIIPIIFTIYVAIYTIIFASGILSHLFNIIVNVPLLIYLFILRDRIEYSDKYQQYQQPLTYTPYTLGSITLNELNTIIVDNNNQITRLYQHIEPKLTTASTIIVEGIDHKETIYSTTKRRDLSTEQKVIYDIAESIPKITNDKFNQILGPIINYKQYEENVIDPLKQQEIESKEYQQIADKYLKANKNINQQFINKYQSMNSFYEDKQKEFKQQVDNAVEQLKQLGVYR